MKQIFSKHKILFILLPCVIAAAVALSILVVSQNRIRRAEDLVSEGNRFLSDLDYSQAIACYQQAINIDPKNRNANLRMAECYNVSGQPAYAEAVYLRMLESNAKDSEVYNKLTELYIQMGDIDKARATMDKAYNKAKKSEIEELYLLTHPEAPSVSAESGSYNERIKVELTNEGNSSADIYYTLDGSEPTVDSTLYKKAIVPKNGTTTIKAITVNSSGFASDAISADYTITIPDTEVEFHDAQMERIIRNILNISSDKPVYNDDIESITELYIIGNFYYSATDSDVIVFTSRDIVNINNWQYSTSNRGEISTFVDIADLPLLETLVVAYQKELDISTIASAKQLKRLSLIGNNLKSNDLKALAGLDSLCELAVGFNDIDSIDNLSELVNLTSLGLWGNHIADISSLSNLKQLEYFDISDNQVNDIKAVSSFDNLKELWIYNNKISDLTPIQGLSHLNVLMLRNNPILDIAPLKKIYSHLSRIDEDLLNVESVNK